MIKNLFSMTIEMFILYCIGVQIAIFPSSTVHILLFSDIASKVYKGSTINHLEGGVVPNEKKNSFRGSPEKNNPELISRLARNKTLQPVGREKKNSTQIFCPSPPIINGPSLSKKSGKLCSFDLSTTYYKTACTDSQQA